MVPRPSFRLTTIRSYGTRTHIGPRTQSAHRPPPRQNDPMNDESAGVQQLEDDNLTFIHRPPSSAPSPLSTTLQPTSPLLRPPSKVKDVPLPPLLRPSAYVKEPPRVTREQIEEIKRLRREDPEKYSRSKLADMFNTTSHFISLIAALKTTKRKEFYQKREAEHQAIREQWGDKKSLAVDIRKRRREFW